MSTDCEELYFISIKKDYKQFYNIYNSFDKSKILGEIESWSTPRLVKLRYEKKIYL